LLQRVGGRWAAFSFKVHESILVKKNYVVVKKESQLGSNLKVNRCIKLKFTIG